MQHCKVLGIGHPRTGTGFTSKICRLWGLDVGHEQSKKDGIVAWQLVSKQGPYPYGKELKVRPEYKTLIYNVRDPKESLPSIVYTEDIKQPSFDYRNYLYKNSMKRNNPIENAIISIIEYDTMAINLKPNIIYRIEDQKENLFDYLKISYPNIRYKGISKRVNKRKHKSFDEMLTEFGEVSREYKMLINNYCTKYGYSKIF